MRAKDSCQKGGELRKIRAKMVSLKKSPSPKFLLQLEIECSLITFVRIVADVFGWWSRFNVSAGSGEGWSSVQLCAGWLGRELFLQGRVLPAVQRGLVGSRVVFVGKGFARGSTRAR